MEMTEIIQGGGILISGVGLKMLFDFGKSYFAARNQKTEVANDPLNVNLIDKYVTRDEFKEAIERMERENSSAHENIFNRLTRNDRDMGEIKGLLTGVANDLQLIKGKLFKTR